MNHTDLSVWRFIGQYQQEQGAPPTLAEIAAACFTNDPHHNISKLLAAGILQTHAYHKTRRYLIRISPRAALCRGCGKPMRLFAPMGDKPHEYQAECMEDGCDWQGVTLPLGLHHTLSDLEAAEYTAANRRLRGRRVEFLARQRQQAGVS